MTRPMHQDAAAAAAILWRTIMVLLLLLLMICLSSFPSVTAECPEKFMCGKVYVHCIDKRLDRIPDCIHPATKELNLKSNKISDIKPLAHLRELKFLVLSFNEIRDIEPLAHLTKLKILDLSFNKIRDIEPLAHLTELQYLQLSNNNISEVKYGAFANLPKLQSLRLDGNNIENIETGVFNNLTSLEEINLKQNKIHKLDLEMFKGITKLETLMLAYNPLTCDCNILSFVNTLKKSYPQGHVLIGLSYAWCHFSVDMREKSLEEITENDFNCTSPDVIVVPENKTVSIGEQLQLSCKAVGDPEPFITWAKDDIDLELGQRVQVFKNNTLIISKVERTDGGQYKCVAFNFFGRKSFEAMVIVNDLAENGCNTMFGVIPGFFFIIIILANCLLYNDIF